MTLSESITDYVNAAFTGIWVTTSEPDEAERELCALAARKDWKAAVWDIANGLRAPGGRGQGDTDPLAALRSLPALANADGTGILILHNFHRFLNSPEVVQTTFSQLIAGKHQRTFIVVLAPAVALPPELEKLFVVLEHALPDRAQLEAIARELVADKPEDMPEGEALTRVIDAAAGLTRYEAEGAFALSLTRKNAIKPEVIWELKAATLKKASTLTLHRGNEDFASLGGLANLKDFCSRALRPGKLKARGVLLLGPSGTGKSAFCKALGNETQRPTLLMDIGALMGSLVGQSEAAMRAALKVADAMSPCILFVDELEKALSGVGSNGDSGVSSRIFGNLLTWLSDHESDVFFVGTSNDISKIPPEFTGAHRFDGVFFIDLPTGDDKLAIWAMYLEMFSRSPVQDLPEDTNWTGAEIKACCRLAALLDVSLKTAAKSIIPVAVRSAEKVEGLRQWANGRCLSATNPGIFQRANAPATQSVPHMVRKINRGEFPDN